MNKILFIFLVSSLNFSLLFSTNEEKYKITGSLPDTIDNVYVYLSPSFPVSDSTTEKQIDSTFVEKGKFTFSGSVKSGNNIYSIYSDTYEFINGIVIIEPGTIFYKYQEDSIKSSYYARGTHLNDLLTDSILIPSIPMGKFGEDFINGKIDMHDPEMAEYVEKMRIYSAAYMQRVLSVTRENIHNSLGEYLFLSYSALIPKAEVNSLLPHLSENIRQKYEAYQNQSKSLEITPGEKYIPFTGKDTENNLFNMADIIDNKELILLDFWASWCAPCIKEMPTIKQLYEEYNQKGLEVIGISLDENEAHWKKAIERHDMPWRHIISNKEEGDNIAEIYGVSAIPYTLLISKEGQIISTNLRGNELIEKVKSILE